jgi:hypothetical protein
VAAGDAAALDEVLAALLADRAAVAALGQAGTVRGARYDAPRVAEQFLAETQPVFGASRPLAAAGR